MSVSFPRHPPEECEECDEDGFLNTYCNDCDQWMCASCDSQIHKKGKRSRHTRRYRKQGEEYTYGDAVRGAGARSDDRESTAGLPADYNTLSPSEEVTSPHFRGGLGGAGGRGPPRATGLVSPFASQYKSKPLDSPVVHRDSEDTPPPPAGLPMDDEEEEEEEEEDTWVPPSAHLRAGINHAPPPPAPSSLFDDPPSSLSTSSPQKIDPLDTPSKVKPNLFTTPSQKDLRSSGKPTPKGPPVVLLSGHLKKRKKKGFRSWQTRYIKLYSNELQYFRKKEENVKAGGIDLAQVKSVVPVTKDKGGLRFDILLAGSGAERTFSFQTSTKEECQQWVKVVTEAMYEVQKDAPPSYAPSSTEPGQTAGGGTPTSSMVDVKEGGGGDESDEEIERDCELTLKISTEFKGYPIPVGNLYYAHDREDKDYQVLIYAVKKKEDNFKEMEKVLLDMAKIENSHFLTLLHHGYSSDRFFVVYQPPGQSLAHLLTQHRRIPEMAVRVIASQLIQGLDWLHERSCVFQNMSTDRVFLDSSDGHAIMGDVFLTLPIEKMPSECATPEYSPPESKYTIVSDWWKLGILLYEIAVGFPPLRSHNKTDIPEKIQRFDPLRLAFPPFLSESFTDFIRKLLNRDPSQRLGNRSSAELKSHEWFVSANINWQNTLLRTLPWLNDYVVDHKVATYHKSVPANYKYTLTVELHEARNLPYQLEKAVYCQLTYEDQQHTTPIIREGDAITWKGAAFSFVVSEPDAPMSELRVDIFPESKSRADSNSAGSVVYSLLELKSMIDEAPNAPLDVWSSIIEPSGLPTFGELHVVFCLTVEKVDAAPKAVVSLQIPFRQTFFDYFGKPGVEDKKLNTLQAASTMGPSATTTTTTASSNSSATPTSPQLMSPTNSVKQPNGFPTPKSVPSIPPRTPSPTHKTRPLPLPLPISTTPAPLTFTSPTPMMNSGIGSRPAAPSIGAPPPFASPSSPTPLGPPPSSPPPLPITASPKRIVPGGSARLPPPLPVGVGAGVLKKTPGRGTNLP